MGVTLTARQRVIIQGTIREAKLVCPDHPFHAAQIAVMTMLAESGARVLANANVPASIKLPHDRLPWSYDGLGHDHASIGSYQQQTGTAWTVPKWKTTMGSPNGWGTPSELMDPATAAGKFFSAMKRNVPHWATAKSWEVAQHVQNSAYDGRPRESNNYSRTYGGNYLGQRSRAMAAVTLLWPTVSVKKPVKAVPAPKPKPTPTAPPTTVIVRAGQYLSSIATANHTTWQNLVELNKKAYPSLVSRPDYIVPGWKLRVR